VPPGRLATATTCSGMEIDFCADLGNSGVRACCMIGIRRHLERISCGIPAESGPDRASLRSANPRIHA
jgi:hypothetical protein